MKKKKDVGPVSWSYGGNLKKKPLGNTKLPYQKSGYKAWKLEKIMRKKKLCPLTYSPFHTIFYSSNCAIHTSCPSYSLYPCAAAGSQWQMDTERQQTKWQAGRRAVSPHTCVLQVEAGGRYTDVRLEGQVQVVGCAVQQLGNCCTWIIKYTKEPVYFTFWI